MRQLIRLVVVAAAVVGAVVFSRASAGQGEAGVSSEAGVASDAGPSTAAGPAPEPGAASGDWSLRDREIFEARVRWADAEGLAALEPGAAIGRLAESFVGTPYTPGTLEADGPEGLVINFREFDCVTFVENMLAMTRFIRDGGADLLQDGDATEARFEEYLTDLRYRGGEINGYPSRLHYFSEWLTDNERMGLLRVVTGDLEPDSDAEQIRFMSTHPEAYRQLADPGVLAEIEDMETRLNSAGPRRFVPQDRIADVADGIRTGDVIATTSTVEGLDIAHTGIAVWIDGRLHMIHAPLVGDSVQISEVPLADRIRSIASQDGIMVARWAER